MAKVVLISALPPLMLKSAINPKACRSTLSTRRASVPLPTSSSS